MAVRKVLTFPDPRLRVKAQPVTVFDSALKVLVADMFETMYEYQGIGLAATQIGINQRVVVIDLYGQEKPDPMVFINPEIDVLDPDAFQEYEEGCLSVPGYYEEVQRPKSVLVRFNDLGGTQKTIEPNGLLAVCIQHERDHLEGKLFVDYLSRLKHNKIKRALEKIRNKKN